MWLKELDKTPSCDLAKVFKPCCAYVCVLMQRDWVFEEGDGPAQSTRGVRDQPQGGDRKSPGEGAFENQYFQKPFAVWSTRVKANTSIILCLLVVLVFKSLNRQASTCCTYQAFCLYNPSRSLRSSDQRLLTVPRARIKLRIDLAFSVVVPKLWNSLKGSNTFWFLNRSWKCVCFP